MSDNIEDFEEVPPCEKKIAIHNAARRRSKVSSSPSPFDEDNQPVIRENNAYLNDNVDDLFSIIWFCSPGRAEFFLSAPLIWVGHGPAAKLQALHVKNFQFRIDFFFTLLPIA